MGADAPHLLLAGDLDVAQPFVALDDGHPVATTEMACRSQRARAVLGVVAAQLGAA